LSKGKYHEEQLIRLLLLQVHDYYRGISTGLPPLVVILTLKVSIKPGELQVTLFYDIIILPFYTGMAASFTNLRRSHFSRHQTNYSPIRKYTDQDPD